MLPSHEESVTGPAFNLSKRKHIFKEMMDFTVGQHEIFLP